MLGRRRPQVGDVAHAPGPQRRSSCFPAALYPPPRHLKATGQRRFWQEGKPGLIRRPALGSFGGVSEPLQSSLLQALYVYRISKCRDRINHVVPGPSLPPCGWAWPFVLLLSSSAQTRCFRHHLDGARRARNVDAKNKKICRGTTQKASPAVRAAPQKRQKSFVTAFWKRFCATK